ncbi:alpha/beta hydrolase [Erythrobacter vulgaris]|uniref:Alpha/beta hydrolase n=1 Tax=Qipengyuania vulgaris TaxID=291985 RepID=A0A844XWF8_9SPHN|nr:patatin-like phospholipase family protein [Qipengyuania vulgaris]MXO49272.1 alpha/beta hydrolase [Qipengyuania vulgaris]
MLRLFALLLSLSLALGGCATWPDRIPRLEAQAEAAQLPGFESVRYWADAPPATFASMREEMATGAPERRADTLLALSGGADDGAYAAGFLKGWSDSGERPQFSIVSGISTGALIAPFAFLGPEYDESLRAFYTEISRKDIYRQRGIVGLLTQPSLADAAPLTELIAANIDEAILDAIALEHEKGRRLLVQTTNLDAGRGVIWDMGAIARSSNLRRLELFRSVLLASASVPGLFAPVMIEVADGQTKFAEMHVDGAVTAGFLAVPETMAISSEVRPGFGQDRIFIILNSRLRPRYETVDPSTFSIIGRALDTVLSAYDRASLANAQHFAANNNVDLAISYIGRDFDVETEELFSQPYMNALFQHGVERGRTGAWSGGLDETAESR